jgi:hypothetical protein
MILFVFSWMGVESMELDTLPDVLIGLASISVGFLAFWFTNVRIVAKLGPETLLVRNALNTVVVPLGEIRHLEPRYEGLRVEYGEKSTAVQAIGKSNLSRLLNRHTRADDAIAEIYLRRDLLLDHERGASGPVI